MATTKPSIAQLYYDTGHGYSEREAPVAAIDSNSLDDFQTLAFPLPPKKITALRFDPLMTEGTVAIKRVSIRDSGRLLLEIQPWDIVPFNQIARVNQGAREVLVTTMPQANDPGLTLRLSRPLQLGKVFLSRCTRVLLVGLAVLLMAGAAAWFGRRGLSRAGQRIRRDLAKGTLCCTLLLLILFFAYLPLRIFSLSCDPVYSLSGLTVGTPMSVLGGNPWLDPNVGFTTQALGKLSADDWLRGVAPWWNSYTGVGLPLAAEMQTSSLFLPFVFLLHFDSGALCLKISLQIIAGLATYLLLRQLGLGRFAAFLGGALYQFNGTFAWFAHAPIMPIAFLPVLLLGIERAAHFNKLGRRGGWALIAIAIAYSIYGGFPETAFFDGLLALVWAIQRVTVAHTQTRLRLASKLLTGAATGLLLAAPVIAPFAQYLGLSGVGHDKGLMVLPTPSAALFLLPYIFGPINEFGGASDQLASLWGGVGGYLGPTLFFFGALALASGKRDRALRWTIAIWIVPLVLRTINFPGFFGLFHAIPGMHLIATFRYSETSWEMVCVVLTALAIDDWRNGQTASRSRILFSLCVALVCGAAALWVSKAVIARLLAARPDYERWLLSSIAWAMALLIALSLLIAARPGKIARILLGGLAVSDAIALFSLPLLSAPQARQIDFAPVQFLQQHLGLERFYTLGPIEPNYGAYFQVASINHNAAPIAGNWTRYIDSALDPGIDLANFVGWFPPPLRDREAAVRSHLEGFENAGVRYLVAGPQSTPLENERLNCVFQDSLLAIFELPHPAPYFETAGGHCELTPESRERVRARCQAPAALTRRELFYPGWRAMVNGRDVPVRSTDSIFQTLDLPKGDSTVVFSYRPSYLGWFCGAALIGAVFLTTGVIAELHTRARANPQEISSVAHLAK